MRAVYLQSVRSPSAGGLLQRVARYRARRNSARWCNVFSQRPANTDDDDDDEDDDYEEDSFCVNGTEPEGEQRRVFYKLYKFIRITSFICLFPGLTQFSIPLGLGKLI